jgi:hypothetical protein
MTELEPAGGRAICPDSKTAGLKGSIQETEMKRKSIGTLVVLVCVLLLPLAASAKSNSSHLNRERLEGGQGHVDYQVP